MYDDIKQIKNHVTKVRLNTYSHETLLVTARSQHKERAVYCRDAILRQLEIDCNEILNSRAKSMGITPQKLVDNIINQYITEHSKPQKTKRGTENVKLKSA